MAAAPKRVSASGLASNALFKYIFGSLFLAFMVGQTIVFLLERSAGGGAAGARALAAAGAPGGLAGWLALVLLPGGGALGGGADAGRGGRRTPALLAPAALVVDAALSGGWVAGGGNAVAAPAAVRGAAGALAAAAAFSDLRRALPAVDDAAPWPFPSREESYPVLRAVDVLETVPIAAVNPRAAMELTGEAAGSRRRAPLPPPETGGVTVGSPCWPGEPGGGRTLYELGLDGQAADLTDAPVPQDVTRSRVRHVGADAAGRVACAFQATPVGGGLQCCCEGPEPLVPPPAGEPPADSSNGPAVAFCIPLLFVTGARHAGVGAAWAALAEHRQMPVHGDAPLTHALLGVRSHKALDGVLPVLALGLGPAVGKARAALGADALPAYFFGDVSVPAFATPHALPALRHLFPRTRLLVLLREPAARAAADITRALIEEGDEGDRGDAGGPPPRALVGGGDDGGGGDATSLAGVAAARAARPALLTLVHACARAAACGSEEADGGPAGHGEHGGGPGGGSHGHGHGTEAGGDPHGSAIDPDAWAASGRASVAACVAAGLDAAPRGSALAGLAAALGAPGGATRGELAECLADGVAPGATADWTVALRRHLAGASAYGETRTLVACPAARGASEGDGDGGHGDGGHGAAAAALPPASPALAAEAALVWGTLQPVATRGLLGCVPPRLRGYAPASTAAWPGRPGWAPSEADLLAAVAAAAAGLARCTLTLAPGATSPPLPDLVAKSAAGWLVALRSVTVTMPADAPAPGAVLLDAGAPGADGQPCFQEGVDGAGLAAALARSIYLAPLARVKATDGHGAAVVADGSTPAARADALRAAAAALGVYAVDAPETDALAKRWAAAHVFPASPAWRGEEVEFDDGADDEPAPPAVLAAIDAALDPYNRALAAFLGVPQPPAGERVPWAALAAAAALPK